MSLENLLKIGQLRKHSPNAREIQRLVAAAGRNLADARVTCVSPETRFDAAHKAIMQCALAALMACGYRPDTNRPGHHMTVIQSLPLTIRLTGTRVTVLDTLRRKRPESGSVLTVELGSSWGQFSQSNKFPLRTQRERQAMLDCEN